MKTIFNKKLNYDYETHETFEAGIELFGFEVKSIKSGKVNIISGVVNLYGGEAYANGIDITPIQENNTFNYDKTRSKKLLIKKSQTNNLYKELENKRMSLHINKIYLKNNLVKVEVSLCSKLKKIDKKEKIKERDLDRSMYM